MNKNIRRRKRRNKFNSDCRDRSLPLVTSRPKKLSRLSQNCPDWVRTVQNFSRTDQFHELTRDRRASLIWQFRRKNKKKHQKMKKPQKTSNKHPTLRKEKSVNCVICWYVYIDWNTILKVLASIWVRQPHLNWILDTQQSGYKCQPPAISTVFPINRILYFNSIGSSLIIRRLVISHTLQTPCKSYIMQICPFSPFWTSL